jgi:hypothetical protein
MCLANPCLEFRNADALSQENAQNTANPRRVKMSFRHHGFALAVAWLIGPGGALAQLAADHPSEMRAMLYNPAMFTITRIDASGTIVLEPAETLPPQFRENVGSVFAEGYYLLATNVAQPDGTRRVLRVEVTDITRSVLTLKTGPEAAARVQIKDSATLVRPVPVSTAWLRELPDEIALAGDPAGAKTDVDPRVAAALVKSINNLKLLGLAMHNYMQANGAFPPAVIFGPDGKPWHSWRVLVLPYLQAPDVYNAYDFSQPWDSPKNKALIDKMPAVYRDPIYGDTNDHDTHYAGFVGPRAIFRPEGAKQPDANKRPIDAKGVMIRQVTDGTSLTMMIGPVEPERRIPWTKPEDIDVGPTFKGLGRPGGIAAPFASRDGKGGTAAPVLICDGSVHLINSSINARTLQALLTCDGGEVVTFAEFKNDPRFSPPQVRTLKIQLNRGKVTAAID